jgi:hypothetical protein
MSAHANLIQMKRGSRERWILPNTIDWLIKIIILPPTQPGIHTRHLIGRPCVLHGPSAGRGLLAIWSVLEMMTEYRGIFEMFSTKGTLNTWPQQVPCATVTHTRRDVSLVQPGYGRLNQLLPMNNRWVLAYMY